MTRYGVAFLTVLSVAATSAAADAIPIFAQRYHLRCTACHSVMPELNAFGNAFRDRGYQLQGLPKHGTTVAAIRYQLEWDRDPTDTPRRFVPGGVVLANADVGQIAAFLHYNLGAQGGPSAPFLGYLANYSNKTGWLVRAGLYELPLSHSPAQRLDDLSSYGYEGAHVGLNDLTLTSPRLGLEAEHNVGPARVAATVAFGEFKGAAYGGKPIDTGVNTTPAQPEVGVFVRTPVGPFSVYTDAMLGQRRIAQVGRPAFYDTSRRLGTGIGTQSGRFDVLGQQWWGLDRNGDGFGTPIGSSGGFARLRYFPTEHAFVAARYDSAATPIVTRQVVLYASTTVAGHARVLIESRHPIGGGTPTLEGALTVGFPWPAKL